MEDLKDVGFPKSIAKFIYKSVACKHIFFNIDGEVIGPRISIGRIFVSTWLRNMPKKN